MKYTPSYSSIFQKYASPAGRLMRHVLYRHASTVPIVEK